MAREARSRVRLHFRLPAEWPCAGARGPRTLPAKLGSRQQYMILRRRRASLRGSGRNAMKRSVKSLWFGALGWALVAVAGIGQALALDYPTRPVHLVAGYPAGGTVDIVARLVGQYLSERLGQQFLIGNRAGARSHIRTEVCADPAPAGQTPLLGLPPHRLNAALFHHL